MKNYLRLHFRNLFEQQIIVKFWIVIKVYYIWLDLPVKNILTKKTNLLPSLEFYYFHRFFLLFILFFLRNILLPGFKLSNNQHACYTSGRHWQCWDTFKMLILLLLFTVRWNDFLCGKVSPLFLKDDNYKLIFLLVKVRCKGTKCSRCELR